MSASELLPQSMQNLRVTEVKSNVEALKPIRYTTSSPDELKFSYLPRTSHKQFYGFWLDHSWLRELGKNVHVLEDQVRPPREQDFWLRGFEHICWAVNIDPLTIEMCLQPKNPDDRAPAEHVDADGVVFVLSLFSDDHADEPVIAFQEQVDYLSKVLGGRKPQWWLSIWRKDWE